MQPAPDPDGWADHLHLVFPATPVAVRDNLARMLSLPPLCRLPDEGRAAAELVLAEVLNNVAEHAYAEAAGPVSVTLARCPLGVSCLIVDQGSEMPGGTLPEGGLPTGSDGTLENLPEGGFGWHLIRSLTLDLTYERAGGDNRLRFALPSGV